MKHTAAYIACLVAVLCAGVASANNCGRQTADNGGIHTSQWNGSGLTSAFSVGMWVKNVSANYGLYCFNWSSATLGCPNTGTRNSLYFRTVQTNIAASASQKVDVWLAGGRSTINDGRWHFLCCTFNYDDSDSSQSFQRLYLDGELAGEATGADIVGPLCDVTSGMRFTLFGVWHVSNSGGWIDHPALTGSSISEVTVWNRALTAAEVGKMNSERVGGGESGLIYYWPFTCNGTPVKNLAVNGAAANLSGWNSVLAMADDDTFPLTNCRCVASPAWVTEHGYVPPAGATFRDWTQPATSISAALAAALPFETVQVMSGTYDIGETLFLTNGQRVVSFNPSTELPDRAGTILDGQGERRVVTVQSGKDEGTELSGFTIRNGSNSGGNGGGAYLMGDASSLANLAKRSRISDCTFENCSADNGGGVCINGGYVTNCTFRNCTAANAGGGICAPRLRYVTSFNAYSERHYTPCIYDCDFDTCEAGLYGGAVGDTSGQSLNAFILENCRIKDCRTNGSGTKRGGHVYAGLGSFILGSTFTGISGANYGNCIAGGWLTISNCTIRGITYNGGYGVVHINGSMTNRSRIVDCVVTNNSTTAALFMLENSYTAATFRNVLCADNPGAEAVVRLHRDLGVVLENCTLVGKGSASALVTSTASPSRYSAVNSILWNGTANGWNESNRNCLTNCCVMSRSGADAEDAGVITDDPKFVDAASGDYSLKRSSPCRDRGLLLDWMSADAVDLLWNPRVVRDGRPLAEDPAALPDIGCYECMLPHVGSMLLVF